MDQCWDIFGVEMGSTWETVKETNRYYGGMKLPVSKAVLPNGSIDPWHALGAIKNLSPDAEAIYINGE